LTLLVCWQLLLVLVLVLVLTLDACLRTVRVVSFCVRPRQAAVLHAVLLPSVFPRYHPHVPQLPRTRGPAARVLRQLYCPTPSLPPSRSRSLSLWWRASSRLDHQAAVGWTTRSVMISRGAL
jgi:hypothetical protein